MNRLSLKQFIGVALSVVMISSLLVSCSNKATEEQLTAIATLRREKASLEQSIRERDSEKARLQRELDSRASELKKCEEDKAAVAARLGSWPNVWPNQEPAKEETKKEMKKKK